MRDYIKRPGSDPLFAANFCRAAGPGGQVIHFVPALTGVAEAACGRQLDDSAPRNPEMEPGTIFLVCAACYEGRSQRRGAGRSPFRAVPARAAPQGGERQTAPPLAAPARWAYVRCEHLVGADKNGTYQFRHAFVMARDEDEAYLEGGRHFEANPPADMRVAGGRWVPVNDYVFEVPIPGRS